VNEVGLEIIMPVHLWHEIRCTNIEKISCCKRNQERHIDIERYGVSEQSTQQETERRKYVKQQCLALTPAPMNQNPEVAELLRDFMCRRREPCRDAKPDIDKKRPGYGNGASAELVLARRTY